jgi:hypothetical protein
MWHVYEALMLEDPERVIPVYQVPTTFASEFIIQINRPKSKYNVSKDHKLLILHKWDGHKYIPCNPKELLKNSHFGAILPLLLFLTIIVLMKQKRK